MVCSGYLSIVLGFDSIKKRMVTSNARYIIKFVHHLVYKGRFLMFDLRKQEEKRKLCELDSNR
jgi:hypothetical protein